MKTEDSGTWTSGGRALILEEEVGVVSRKSFLGLGWWSWSWSESEDEEGKQGDGLFFEDPPELYPGQ